MSSNLHQVYILIAPRFNEGYVVECLTTLRKAGLSVGLVANNQASVQGCYGMCVQPDLTISEVDQHINVDECALVLPGSAECFTQLLSDARFFEIISSVLETGSANALLTIPAASPRLSQVGIPINPHAILIANQGPGLNDSLKKIVARLI